VSVSGRSVTIQITRAEHRGRNLAHVAAYAVRGGHYSSVASIHLDIGEAIDLNDAEQLASAVLTALHGLVYGT
jgi:hypothetical protein